MYNIITNKKSNKERKVTTMTELTRKLVDELNNLEISYSLDLENDIKEACSSLDINPNEYRAKHYTLHHTGRGSKKLLLSVLL